VSDWWRKTGIHKWLFLLDARFRGHDDFGAILLFLDGPQGEFKWKEWKKERRSIRPVNQPLHQRRAGPSG